MTDSATSVTQVGFAELTRPDGDSRRDRDAVVFLPHAGGDHNSYRAIAGHVQEARVFGAVYPGRLADDGDRTMDIAGVANGFAEAFHWDAFDRVMIVGHSMGGLIAHSLCATLEDRGYQPDGVIISSAIPPMSGLLGGPLPTEPVAVLEHIVALGGTPAELLNSAWFREAYLPMIAADYRAVNEYMTTTPPVVRSRLQLFSSDRDASISPDAMLGWREYTTGGLVATTFAGGHFYLFEDPATVAGHFSFTPASDTRSTK